jgi:hypothetical protein
MTIVPSEEEPRESKAKDVVTPTALDAIKTDALLAAYVERFADDSFTPEAKAEVLSEMKHYAVDLRNMAQLRRRSDGRAEKVLKRHVADSAASLRNARESPLKMIADWCKWTGFAFLGFAVTQFNNVHGQKVIARGSVNWLVFDVIMTVALIAAGFAIERPLNGFLARLRGRRSSS